MQQISLLPLIQSPPPPPAAGSHHSLSIHHLKQLHSHMLRTHLFFQDTFSTSRLLHSAASLNLHYAAKIHSQIKTPNSFMWNTLIRSHAWSPIPIMKNRAIMIYVQMLSDGFFPDKHSFPFVLKSCAFLLALIEGIQIHGHVLKLGFASDVYVCNSLVHFYMSNGLFQSAHQVFDEMSYRSLVSWNVLIEGCVQTGRYAESLELFREMQELGDMVPDGYTMNSVVSASRGLGAVGLGTWAHAFVVRKGVKVDVSLGNALVDMYTRCGRLEMGREVFDCMAYQDVSSYNTMIFGYAIHGFAKEAMSLYMRMDEENVKPNMITFVGVLSACSHCGLVDEGREVFDEMTRKYSIEPRIEHYGCMVDLLARLGYIEDAQRLISTMSVEPDAAIWRSMLHACGRSNVSVQYSEFVAKKLRGLDDGASGLYVLLSRAYASSSKWTDVGLVRKTMSEKGVMKEPGCTSIEMDGIVHEFVAGDTSHPQTEEIYCMLDHVYERLKSSGLYVPDLSEAVMVDEHISVKEDSLRLHSEKLAIAFGLLNRRRGIPIRVMKNLRICSDCHVVSKLISSIFDVEIIMRDRARFHHFKEGICSCSDFW